MTATSDVTSTTSSSWEQERQEILAEIEGRTLVDVFMATCDANSGRDALVVAEGEGFRALTWSEYRSRSSEVAMGLRELGVDRHDFVALMMTNRPEHVVSDIGVLLAGATPVSVYNTLTADQIRGIADDCSATVAIVEDAAFLDRWLRVADELDGLTHLVVIDPTGADTADARVVSYDELVSRGRAALDAEPTALETHWRQVEPDDTATLIYTSGTTGPPKGVVLTHRNLLFQLAVIQRVLDIEPGQQGISYLPLAHVAERIVTHYIGVRYGGTIYFVPDVSQVVDTLQEARPQMFMAVPRVWEKMHAALLARIDADGRRAAIAHKALAVGTAAARAEAEDGRVPVRLRAQRALFDRLVFSKIRHGLGLDQLRYAVSGAAPISGDLLLFFRAIGIEILEVYGMTETTAIISANRPGQVRIGSVGPPAPGIEIRLADDGEILVRGPVVTPGYWRNDAATRQAIDTDGWLHTGDLGVFDEDGYLTIVGRKKELIITAGGKNLSPNNIEDAIRQRSPVVGQVCAVGDDRAYVAALIVLDAELLPGWCESQGIEFTSVEELASDDRVVAEVQRAVDEGNEQLARVEQVRSWAIVPGTWTAESEELTPSLKLRRSVVHDKYVEVIERLYTPRT